MLKPRTSVKLKAAFLFVVFALNTLVGFACSMGVDMGFNSKHHENEEGTEAVVHVHKDGKQHIHYEKKEKHSHSKSHHHDQANTQKKETNKKDNCCKDKVRQFEQLDKSVPQSTGFVHPVFFTPFIASYFYVSPLPDNDIVKNIKQFVRSYHPPIADIRIAIQSFQI